MSSSLTYLRSTGVTSQRRGLRGPRQLRETKFGTSLHADNTSKPHILSTKFRHRFIQRYQYGMYADCYAFFKTLLWNSLKEGGATSVGNVSRGGQAAVVFGLMARNKLMYEVAVPENLIRMSGKEKSQSAAVLESLTTEETAAGGGSGAMALGRSSGGQPRIGQRSMSRLVLLATRESQDSDLQLTTATDRGVKHREDTHEYHEQLHIVPFMVLVTLSRDGTSAAPAAAAAQDGPTEVDQVYMPISPLLGQQVREDLGRMLSAQPPDEVDTVRRLVHSAELSSQQAGDVTRLLELLRAAGVQGMEPARLLAESGLDRRHLCRLTAVMERHELLLRAGITRLLYVSRAVGQPWILHSYHMTRQQQEAASSAAAAAAATSAAAAVRPAQVAGASDSLAAIYKSLQPVFFQPTPWRRISGTVNRRVLDRLAGAVLSHAMTTPGGRLAGLQCHFHPMLSAHQVRLLAEVLQTLGCLQLTETRQVSRTTLFSRHSDLVWHEGPADDCTPADAAAVLPCADAVLRYACFVGDKPYGSEFLDNVGV